MCLGHQWATVPLKDTIHAASSKQPFASHLSPVTILSSTACVVELRMKVGSTNAYFTFFGLLAAVLGSELGKGEGRNHTLHPADGYAVIPDESSAIGAVDEIRSRLLAAKIPPRRSFG